MNPAYVCTYVIILQMSEHMQISFTLQTWHKCAE